MIDSHIESHSSPHAVRRQWRAGYLVIALAFLILTNLVYVSFWARTPSGYHYTGVGLEAAGDKFVYLSMIQQGMAGKLFMRNTMTLEPQRGLLFSPHWYLAGITARFFRLAPALSYHLYRVLFTIPFLILVYFLVSRLFTSNPERYIAAATILLPGGGWWYLLARPGVLTYAAHWLYYFNDLPADLYVPEMVPLLNFMQSPLFILSHALLALILYLCVRHPQTSLLRTAALAALVCFLVLVHPYDGILLVAVIGSWSVVRFIQNRTWREFIPFAAVMFGTLAAYAYHFFAFQADPALTGWREQNITISPDFSTYAWAFGIVGVLALVGAARALLEKRHDPVWLLIIVWFLTPLLLIYAPLVINRRLTNAWFLPAGFLAAYGFFWMWRRFQNNLAVRISLASIVGVLAFGGVAAQVDRALYYQIRPEEQYAYYLDSVIWEGLQYANQSFGPNDRVLPNNPYIGTIFSGYTSSLYYIGHQHQTLDYPLKESTLAWFFSDSPSAASAARKRDFVETERFSYVVVYKPVAAQTLWLRNDPLYRVVFENAAVVIFSVIAENSDRNAV